jgi:adenosylcobyric acid synthase
MKPGRLMIQGTASSAGKSLLVTALCRVFLRRGFSPAPFKSQNMALNSFVTDDQREIGRAQAVQAQAAGLAPETRMNPILLKPSSDRKSQVIVDGLAIGHMDATEYFAFRPSLRPKVERAFASLAAEHSPIIIEGAGSPAEINLLENDLVNMGMAALAEAPVVLVADIDRGGVFAALYGTVMLLPEEDRVRIKGFVINKFRGSLSILEPGIRRMEELLDIPCLGVLPFERFDIDDEDGLAESLLRRTPARDRFDVAAVRLSRLSNFTDLAVFDRLAGVSLRWVELAEELGTPDLLILPGSKSTAADLEHLRAGGLALEIQRFARQGGCVFGICGGFQMLGHTIEDPDGVEDDVPRVAGLGLLDVRTRFHPDKSLAQAEGRTESLPGGLRQLSDLPVRGYEIHMGQTTVGPDADPLVRLADGRVDGAVNAAGTVAGTYLHGIFDSPDFAAALVNALGGNTTPPLDPVALREAEFDRLADFVEAHLDIGALARIAGIPERAGE